MITHPFSPSPNPTSKRGLLRSRGTILPGWKGDSAGVTSHPHNRIPDRNMEKLELRYSRPQRSKSRFRSNLPGKARRCAFHGIRRAGDFFFALLLFGSAGPGQGNAATNRVVSASRSSSSAGAGSRASPCLRNDAALAEYCAAERECEFGWISGKKETSATKPARTSSKF